MAEHHNATYGIGIWKKVTLVLFIILLLITLLLRIGLINASLPYVLFLDEPTLTVRAAEILESGDFNTKFYIYPPFPVYLTAVGVTAGLLANARLTLHLDGVGSPDYPYYQPADVYKWPRYLFALFSVGAIAIFGFLLRRAYKAFWTVLGMTMVLMASGEYLFHSWAYINIDIAGVFFSSLAIATCYQYRKEDSFWLDVIMGVTSGLAIACKYSLALILLVPVATVLLYKRKRPALHLTGIVLGSAVGFLLMTPFALADFNLFVEHVLMEMRHYQAGHAGFTVEGFGAHLAQNLSFLGKDFGWFGVLLAPLGLIALLRKHSRRTTILFIFPIAHLLFISQQSVSFPRNILIVYLFAAFLVSYALVAGSKALLAWTRIEGSYWNKAYLRYGSVALLPVLFLLLLPWGGIIESYDMSPDTRQIAVSWIQENIEPGNSIVIAEELGFYSDLLNESYSIEKHAFYRMSAEDRDAILSKSGKGWIVYPQYIMDPRHPKKNEGALALNQYFKDRVNRQQRFGEQGVFENYSQPVPKGDPWFYIGKIRPENRWRAPE